jgi:hypothetical protein
MRRMTRLYSNMKNEFREKMRVQEPEPWFDARLDKATSMKPYSRLFFATTGPQKRLTKENPNPAKIKQIRSYGPGWVHQIVKAQ